MCGICGIIGRRDARQIVAAMLPRLRHRGPDNTTAWDEPGTCLGHTRLAIVDLSSKGNQPFLSEDQGVALVCNGEIYNSAELRRELQRRGHRFHSHSDNEVLLHLYEEQGENCAREVNGMAAFALWDRHRRRLLLGRDRLGIKPLYYHLSPRGWLAFASEIKALLACAEVPARIDPQGLYEYLVYENTFGRRSLLRDIAMLEPGEMLIYEEGNLRRHRFWEPRFMDVAAGRHRDWEDACVDYRQTAREAVRRHLMSDVRVASYLSGGLDSTSVAALARREMRGELLTFTGGFDRGGWYDETPVSAAVAGSLGSRHAVVRMRGEDLARNLDDLIYALDEPRMGPGSFSQYCVARRAAAEVKVILTGHGGDEFFGGYPVFKYVHLFGGGLRGAGAAAHRLLLAPLHEWSHLVYFAARGLQADRGACFLPVVFPPRLLEQGLQPDPARELDGLCPDSGLESLLQGEDDPYRRLTLTYLRAYLPGLFVVEDKVSMAHSLESRTPLCDNAMLELALRLPLGVKLHGGKLKAVPKEAMRDLLPSVVYAAPKRGFPTPLGPWFRGELAPWMEDRLLGGNSALHYLFRPQYLRRLVRGYRASWKRVCRPLDQIPTHRVWILLCLEAWLRVTRERIGRELLL